MYPSCLTRLSAKIEHTRSKVLRCLCNFLSCLSKLSMLVSCPCCCTSPVVPSLSSPWLFSSSSCSPAASPDCVCLNLCTFFNTVQKGRQLAILKFRAWNLLRVTWQERDNLGIGLLYTYLYIYIYVCSWIGTESRIHRNIFTWISWVVWHSPEYLNPNNLGTPRCNITIIATWIFNHRVLVFFVILYICGQPLEHAWVPELFATACHKLPEQWHHCASPSQTLSHQGFRSTWSRGSSMTTSKSNNNFIFPIAREGRT